MDPIANDALRTKALWTWEAGGLQAKEKAIPTSPKDTVSLSPEARSLAGAPDETIASDESNVPQDVQWGPDLIQGWEDESYLKVHKDGTFTGSLSLTNEFGTMINIAAEQNQDGKAARTVMVTIQKADGSTQQHRIEERSATTRVDDDGVYRTDYSGGYLRISETDDGIAISTNAHELEGRDGDDIVIAMGTAASGGAGNDTLVSLGGSIYGNDGDDTLVAVGLARGGSGVHGGDGNDRVYARNFGGMGGVTTGTGENTIVIDRAGGFLDLSKRGPGTNYKDGDVVSNDISIEQLRGSVTFLGEVYHNAKLSIGTALNSVISTRKGQFDIEIKNLLNSRLHLESDEASARIRNAVDSIILVKGGQADIESSMGTARVVTERDAILLAGQRRYNQWKSEEEGVALLSEVVQGVPQKATDISSPHNGAARQEPETVVAMYAGKDKLLAGILDDVYASIPYLDGRSLHRKV